MAVEAILPTIGTVVITAAIDSINPCAIGVLVLLISTVITGARTKKALLKFGLAYIGAVFITYIVAGLGLTYFFVQVPIVVAEYVSIAVAMLVIGAGLIEIKDFYWYGRGFSLAIPPEYAKKIDDLSKNLTIPGVMFLGAFVAAVELPCTGAPYLAIITLLSQNFDFTAFLLLILYNFIFVLPLLVILFIVYFGVAKVQDIKRWKQDNRGYMRLAVGLLLVVLGWALILIANGVINIG
ncbi:MAG TPA: GAP family protein [archaeon]|nr:GAP family protein [archaeon]